MNFFERKKERPRVELSSYREGEGTPVQVLEATYSDVTTEHADAVGTVEKTKESLEDKAAAIEPVTAEQKEKLEAIRARIAEISAETQQKIKELVQIAIFSILMGSAPMAEATSTNPEAQTELINEFFKNNPEALESVLSGNQIVAKEVAAKDPENKAAAESAIQSGELLVEVQERKTTWEKISENPEVQDLLNKAIKCAFDAAQLGLVYSGFELLKSVGKAAHSFFQKLAARAN